MVASTGGRTAIQGMLGTDDSLLNANTVAMLPVQNVPIDSMPGVYRLGWRHGLLDEVAEARSYGVNQVGGQQGRMLVGT